MIELEKATKRFRIAPGPGRDARTVVALSGLTLSIPAGTALGVVGPMARERARFRMILGFLKPTSGRVAIGGVAPRDMYAGTGGIPAGAGSGSSRLGSVALTALAGWRRSRRGGPCGAARHRAGLEEHAGSGRGRCRAGCSELGLAQALLAPRALVVLDEPTEAWTRSGACVCARSFGRFAPTAYAAHRESTRRDRAIGRRRRPLDGGQHPRDHLDRRDR